jgi:exopolysaccharide biosynthesis protein
MLLVAVDGRQPRLSTGLTQPQLASYMQWLGAYQAMEFDSGGSVTMVVRLPGHRVPDVVNSPSDGHERPIANALLIFSKPGASRPGR